MHTTSTIQIHVEMFKCLTKELIKSYKYIDTKSLAHIDAVLASSKSLQISHRNDVDFPHFKSKKTERIVKIRTAMELHVCLPSGRSALVKVAVTSKVSEVSRIAQEQRASRVESWDGYQH